MLVNSPQGLRRRWRAIKNDKLRHRIRQWSVIKFVKMLKTQPIDVVEVSEPYTSSINPFNGEKLRKGKQVVEKVIRVLTPT